MTTQETNAPKGPPAPSPGPRPAKRPLRRRLDLKKTLFILPNLITVSSIFCGFDSIRIASHAETSDDFHRAALLIIFAMFFDMLDGRVARMTKTQSAFGLQIDSLADVMSFGLAPAILVYEWALSRFDVVGLVASFLFVACAAIRLARFNVLAMAPSGEPTKASKFFLGLPTPGAAGILVSIVVATDAVPGGMTRPEYAWVVFGVTLALAAFMVSNVQFRTFKDVRLNVRTILFVAFAIGSSAIISTQTKPALGLVWLLGFYVLMGIFETLWRLPGRIREKREAAAAAVESERTSRPE
jgi:CDP-diacylglycerol--serine O-phosphatidyltransferase